MRLLLLGAANALCLFVLWKVVVDRRAQDAHTQQVAAGAPAAVADTTGEGAEPRRVERDTWLEGRIRKRIGDALHCAVRESEGKLNPASVGIAVHAREVGLEGDLVALDAERSMRPASNMKLVTSAAALVLLGRDGSFETVFESDAPLVDGRLAGDLVVRAGGDPIYDPAARGNVDAWFARVVAELARAGIVAIDGALVLDEGDFQPPAPGPGWPAQNQHWKDFCALAAGFSANAGCLTANVRARSTGQPAEVVVEPRDHGLVEKFDVDTLGPRAALTVRVQAQNGVVRVEGSIPKDVPEWSARFAAPDPVELFGEALAGALAAGGIEVGRGWKRERRPELARHRLARVATPLADALVPINTHSNNPCADQLFLALGHIVEGAGTRAGGRAATARALARLGVPSDGLVQVDGSGLSRDNRVSARQITALIGAVLRLDAKTSRLFVDSLALAGESGTLDDRMSDPDLVGRVHAKTGFIAGTSALSGVLDAHDGRALVFSILVEYPPIDGLNLSCWKPMQDAICADLVAARRSDG